MKSIFGFVILPIILVCFPISYQFCTAIEVSKSGHLESNETFRDFDGFRVYRLNASTKAQFDSLVKLHDEDELDFWQTPQLLTFTDIMVSKDEEERLLEFVKEHKIDYTVMIDNVAKVVSEQHPLEKSLKEPRLMDWTQYHSFETIYDWMDHLGKEYSDIASVETIGTSTEGIPLRLIKIALDDRPNKPGVFIDATFHAREWISTATATFIINELVTKSETYTYLLEEYDFYFLPIVNPDGYRHTFNLNRLWRKTRVPGSKIENLIGCRGVDLNRNFGHMFGGNGSSTSPCSLTYRGPNAFSEPESAAIRDFVINKVQDWRFYLSLHSYGQKWLTPWAFTDELPEDYIELERIGKIGAEAIHNVSGTQYQVGTNSEILYLASGGSDDWFKAVAGFKYAYTLELPDTGLFGFLYPAKRIMPTAKETWTGIQAALVAVSFT